MTDRHAGLPDGEDDDATIVPEDYSLPPAPDVHREMQPQGQSDEDLFDTHIADETVDSGQRKVSYDSLIRGDQIGDFRILRLLGRGSFGAVYLARELTLDRLVAVKVVLPEGKSATAGEGRNLARLKHPNIVGVFGEADDPESGCSLLWMQYVEGANLASLIERLYASRDRESCQEDWCESDLLRLLNVEGNPPPSVGSNAETRGSLETVCRIGQRLAEALSHAHQSGVTHRDIKPANILMQLDGTPSLADFNLSDNVHDDRKKSVGGTVAYMPPEQLADVLGKKIDFDAARADIYSLGVVLWELAWGQRPYESAELSVDSSGSQQLFDILAVRERPLIDIDRDIPIGLSMVLRRALEVEPERRFPSAQAMATALSGLEQLQRARRHSPATEGVRKFVRKHLFWLILICGVLPHVAASMFQSWYNYIWIIRPGGEEFQVAFRKAFIAYNVVVYPACVGWLAWVLYQFARGYRRVVAREPVQRGYLRKLRGRLLRLPRQCMIASALGWFPGIILFPWLLGRFGQPPSQDQWFHFAISFAIAGLIATTYAYAMVVYVVVCQGYRVCWQTATHYLRRARSELSGMERRIYWVSILTGILPLAAAVLLLAIGMPVDMNGDDHSRPQFAHGDLQQERAMHQLLIALIVSGAIGLYVVQTASTRLIRAVRALILADDGG